jgi:nitroimidazol reductase NimA-like FMN-containing flavoprotein (pyridoxamine 5'-phosphate oxidase superfamily)
MPSPYVGKIRELFDRQKVGVLGSNMDGMPYLNLVAFIPYRDYRSLIFVTSKSTRKYANLLSEPSASMMIDNRQDKTTTLEARGVTVCGAALELAPGAEVDEIIALYLKRHPALESFIKSPTIAIFELKISTCYYVENFQEVTEIHFEK